MITVFFVDIKEKINNTKLEQYKQLVSPEKREHFQGKLNIYSKLRIYAEVLLQTQICKDLKLKNHDITFVSNIFGKPSLTNYPNYYFSISHTNNAIAIAFSENQIGIDIERIQNADLRIAQRFYCEKEKEYIYKDPNNINERFYEIWTKKEAYIKYIGKGLSIPLNSFDTLEKKLAEKICTSYIGNYIVSTCNDSPQAPNILTLHEQDIELMAETILMQ